MLSLNINVDFCPDERLNRALTYLIRTKQKTVVISGGAQQDRSEAYVERVRAALPNIVIMYRILEDTGIIIQLSPDQWYAKYVTPRLSWAQRNRVTFVLDNETSGDNGIINLYVSRSIVILVKLHAIGLGGVVCRFATGTIDDGTFSHNNQYPLLAPLLNVLTDKDWVGPNEYSNLPPGSSSGHLERWKKIRSIAPNKKINYSIGEAGILRDYQANEGYVPYITGDKMAAQLIAEEMWYDGGTVPRHVFCMGGTGKWVKLQIDDAALNFLEEYYARIGFPSDPPPAPPPPPPQPEATLMVSTSLLLHIKYALEMASKALDSNVVELTSTKAALQSEITSLVNLLKGEKS